MYTRQNVRFMRGIGGVPIRYPAMADLSNASRANRAAAVTERAPLGRNVD
jgi:hypothetical protein